MLGYPSALSARARVWLWVGGIVAADFFAKSQLLSAVCHQVAFRAAQVPPLGFAALHQVFGIASAKRIKSRLSACSAATPTRNEKKANQPTKVSATSTPANAIKCHSSGASAPLGSASFFQPVGCNRRGETRICARQPFAARAAKLGRASFMDGLGRTAPTWFHQHSPGGDGSLGGQA
jgi:hypothetical protein